MTTSAIVRHVDALEASLGVAPVRSTRAVTPTDASERLMRCGQRLLDELADLRRDAPAQKGVAGVLRGGVPAGSYLETAPPFARLADLAAHHLIEASAGAATRRAPLSWC